MKVIRSFAASGGRMNSAVARATVVYVVALLAAGCATSQSPTRLEPSACHTPFRVSSCVSTLDLGVPCRAPLAVETGDWTVAAAEVQLARATDTEDIMELPHMTVKSGIARSGRLALPLPAGVALCTGCPQCKPAVDPAYNWKLAQMRVEEDGEIGILPALIFTTREGKLEIHWRRF